MPRPELKKTWSLRLVVRTPAFHVGYADSTSAGITTGHKVSQTNEASMGIFSGTRYGHPAGNLRMGRRFSPEELARIEAGTDPEEIVKAAPPPLTREEMYSILFGGDNE